METRTLKIGDRAILKSCHHAHKAELKQQVGCVGTITKIETIGDGFEPKCLIQFDGGEWWVRDRYLKKVKATDLWAVGEVCYVAAFRESPCTVRGFNVNNSDLARLGYDIVVEIKPDVCGSHGGYFPCKSQYVYRSPDAAIAQSDYLSETVKIRK